MQQSFVTLWAVDIDFPLCRTGGDIFMVKAKYSNSDSEFLYKGFVINVLQFHFFFAKPSMNFIQLWRSDKALSKILCSTILNPVHDLNIKITDFEFFVC